ncbi:MAG: putative toxin-antitoxin system toxin component, PIN family [Bacteroidota bacterium]
MKVVLDTNALLASFARKSPYRLIFDALLAEKIDLYVSTEILLEYEEIISQKATPLIAQNVMELLTNLPNSYLQEVWFRWNLISEDPDDNKFTDCTLAAGADYLVTNDKHFGVLLDLTFPPLRIISIQAFRDIIMNG